MGATPLILCAKICCVWITVHVDGIKVHLQLGKKLRSEMSIHLTGGFISGEVVKAQLLLRTLRQVKLHCDITNLGVRTSPLRTEGEFF